ncbi:MAG: cadmium-translocating P-type ATPase [Oscillospiraceae bacterium]|nr:cadmium-translocating P-type ATPase [Oscillospiraceae bacterium]MCI2205564.1 cadmium-translocating P-type ATPase [Oscillospiraceae bacterium]
MEREQKKQLIRIIVSGILFAASFFLPLDEGGKFIFCLIPYLVIGWDILWEAIKNLIHGKVFDENFLMALATIGALGIGKYDEAVEVMLFFQVGEFFEDFAVDRSRRSISSLMDIRPDSANLEKDGAVTSVSPEEVAVGDVILIKAGERVPLDGIVLEGDSSLDTKALTGESVPRTVKVGDAIISGCINQSGLLRVQVTKVFSESTVTKILDLVENSSSKKAPAENFITKFSHYYTPAVVFSALALFLLPPLITGGQWLVWLERALTFLVVSCPCALVISIPLSFFGGIGGASKCGILVKGGNYLEALSKAETVVFDKTGTLTEGTFQVTAVHPDKISEKQLLEMAALAESYSDHPISLSLKNAYTNTLDSSRVTDVEEIPGHGVCAKVDGRTVYAGNSKLMEKENIPWHACHLTGTVVHVAVDGIYAGHIIISDQIKPDSAKAVSELKKSGVRRTVMLTGDSEAVGAAVAKELGLDEYHTELLPADKVEQVERLLKDKSPKGQLVFVGDGMNDAPVLARADIGIAMGALGSDAAIEAADIVLMDDQPSKIATAISISRKTLQIVRQNIIFAIGIKIAVLILSAFGLANMQAAVFADVGVSILAILNASRALSAGKREK